MGVPSSDFRRAPWLFALLGSFAFGDHLVRDEVHPVSGAQPLVILDSSNVTAIHKSRPLGFRMLIVVQIVFVAGFLEVVLQLFLRLAAALPHCADLLCGRRGVGVLVRAMIVDTFRIIYIHTEIVPPYVSAGKEQLQGQRTTAGPPAVAYWSWAPLPERAADQ